MPLAASNEAIGAVTQMLQDKIIGQTGINVSVGRPELAAGTNTEGAKLNLFLYQVGFDPHLRNLPLDDGQPVPLWTVLHYLITAFDGSRESDSVDAHRLLGRGLTALQALNYIRPDPTVPDDPALLSNPEPLKVSFDNADVELLSKVMQGTDEKYRVSASFQVRPVMLATEAPPAYAPAVLSVGPPAAPGVVVLASLGPRLEPLASHEERFEAGATLELSGADLASASEVCFGATCLPASFADGTLNVTVPLATTLSPGSYPVTAVRILPSGRRFSSNAVLARLLPTLATATPGTLTPAPGGRLHGDLALTGVRLGGPNDGIFVALYRDGRCAQMLEVTGVAAQNTLTVPVTPEQAIEPGTYQVILRVNGEQATNSPAVNWV